MKMHLEMPASANPTLRARLDYAFYMEAGLLPAEATATAVQQIPFPVYAGGRASAPSTPAALTGDAMRA